MRSMLLRSALATVVAASMALTSGAQTLGCEVGGTGGAFPLVGTGDGTFPGTLPTSPNTYTITVSSLPPGATVVTEVKLNGFTHTYQGDIQFVLTDPSGATHNLLCRPTGGCDFNGNYSIQASCTGGIAWPTTCITPVPLGAYDQYFGTWPSGTNGIFNTPLSSIAAATGVWTLTAYDWVATDVGNVASWDLCFGTPPAPSAPSVAPALTAPAAGASAFGPTVSLTWGAVGCATSYEVDVDGTIYAAASTSYVYTSAAGAHTWTVRGVNATGSGPWATSRVFNDLGLPPTACNGPSLSTVYATNNGLGTGSCCFFDVNVLNAAGITVSQLDQNTTSAATTAFSVAIWTRAGTSVGFEQTTAGWTNVANGAGVAVGTNLPSLVEFPDFQLAPGLTGFCVVLNGIANSYTNGTGANQLFSNADLSISLGKGQATPFVSAPFTPRVWNGTLRYNCTPPVASYCTAGTTSNGCVPVIAGTGLASASQTSGFTISVSQVEGQQSGLLFYGVNGPVAVAWGTSSSFFCVKAPTWRTPVQNSGGTLGACDGTFSIDWLAYIAATPGALGTPFAGGDTVNAQAWFRDPPSPKTTMLSDGLQYTLVP